MSKRTTSMFPSEAARKCLSGHFARRGHLFEQATTSYRQALVLCPYLWEAFEGLCALGQIPPFIPRRALTNVIPGTAPEDIDELFSPRKLPDTFGTLESALNPAGPVATGTGFFTPEPNTVLLKPHIGGKKDNRMLGMELPTGSVYVLPPLVSPPTA